MKSMTIDYEKKWGIDSNLLVYFLDADSKFHQSTIALFKELLNHSTPLYTTQNNVIEAHRVLVSLYHVPKKIALENIIEIINSFNIHIVTPLSLTINTYSNFCQLSKKNDLFDLYFASILVDNHVHNLLTGNIKDFVGFEKHLAVYSPF